MVRNLGLGDYGEVRHLHATVYKHVIGEFSRFRVMGGAGAAEPSRGHEVDQTDAAENLERLAPRLDVEVSTDDDRVVWFCNLPDEVSQPLGLRNPFGGIGLSVVSRAYARRR